MKQVIILFVLIVFTILASAQEKNVIKGTVLNKSSEPIGYASIRVIDTNLVSQTDIDGNFVIPTQTESNLTIEVKALGYKTEQKTVTVKGNKPLIIVLEADNIALSEVVVEGSNDKMVQMKSSQNLIKISRSYIEENFSGSLMQSLEAIPGVKAMNIGSGQSKPAIRGLGFNRMLVSENGVKHEGQQWGEDHGLEIDQFAVDNIEIIKGPGSLLYGSDAIGGVVNLQSNYVPLRSFEGKANLFVRSNNESIGLFTQVAGKKKNLFYKANLTLIDYADYKVPTDSIQYFSYYIKLKDRRLRNTAGKEHNATLMGGYITDKFQSIFQISDVYAKSGFFADAHGLEVRLSDIDYDKSSRDIDYPLHSVNHLKVMNNSVWQSGIYRLEGNFSYQNNIRKEYSEPVSHGYMPIPPNALERKFNKSTYTANLGLKFALDVKHNINAGVNIEHQNNRREGWGFIIPDFESTFWGAYIFDRYHISDNLILSAGMRYDGMKNHIHRYQDWYKTPVEGQDSIYKERSAALTRTFNSFTWSAGINYSIRSWILKANIGKSFRAPIPKELGSDGVNYHIFRYEKGNPNLSPEESYQIDLGINWSNDFLTIQVDPYLNYFPNYIYMNPTASYYEGLQMYHYTQSRVVRYGFESELKIRFSRNFETGLAAEYLYSEQLSGDKKGYTLPFSPPWSANINIKYSPHTKWAGADGFISLIYKIVGDQNQIVPPENKTRGYQIFNLSAGKSFKWKDYKGRINLQMQNLFNKKYYDHTSYYRLIDVPEPGRNFSMMIGLDF